MKKTILLTLVLFLLLANTAFANNNKLATVYNPITGHKKVVVVGDKHAFDNGYKLWINEERLGYSVITNYSPRLSSSMTSTQTTVPVTSMTTKDSHTITMADLGSIVYLTIEPGASKEEIVSCTGISSLSFTGCTRGLAFYGTSTVAVVANQKSHQSGSSVVMSNTHYTYEQLVDLDTAQTITGVKTFASTTIPKLDAYLAPTDNAQFAPKKYVDDVSIVGAADATTGVKGISEIATKAEAALGTVTGGTGANLLLPSSMATSTSQVATTSIPVTGTDGKLDQSFLDFTENFNFTSTTTITGNAYLNISGTSSLIIDLAINGSATPQAVAIATTTGYVVKADANDITAVRVFGFITSNAGASSTPYIQTAGIVRGFSGLTKGTQYFVSDTAGSVSSTQSTTTIIPIGQAISATEILLNFGRKTASATVNHSAADGATENTTITVGFAPSVIIADYSLEMDLNGVAYLSKGTASWKGTTLTSSLIIYKDDKGTALTGTTIGDYVAINSVKSDRPGSGTGVNVSTLSISSILNDGFVSTFVNTDEGSNNEATAGTVHYLIME